MLNLDEIKKRAAAATPGQWVAFETGILSGSTWVVANVERSFARSADGEFIAHARTDIPALVAEVERLRAEVVRLEEMVARHRCSVGGPP